MELVENNIEFISGERTATLTFTNGKHVRAIKKLYENRPDDFKYFIENKDGSVCAKIPLKWVKVSPPRSSSRVFTEEEKAAIAARLAKARENKKK